MAVGGKYQPTTIYHVVTANSCGVVPVLVIISFTTLDLVGTAPAEDG